MSECLTPLPLDLSGVVENRFRHRRHDIFSVSTASRMHGASISRKHAVMCRVVQVIPSSQQRQHQQQPKTSFTISTVVTEQKELMHHLGQL